MKKTSRRLGSVEQETILTATGARERQTTIRRAAPEEFWHVFSEDPREIRRLTKLFGEGVSVGQHGGKEWQISKNVLRISRPRRLSAAQRAAAAERMRGVRRSRSSERADGSE